MNGKSSSNRNTKECFTSDAWTALSEYEKRRYENAQKRYKLEKTSGMTPKTPELIMSKYKRSMLNKNKDEEDRQRKDNQETKQKFKLFTVSKQPASKRKNSNEDDSSDISIVFEKSSNENESSDISTVFEMNSPSIETRTATTYNLRRVKRKELSQKVSFSTENARKEVEDKVRELEEDQEDVTILSESGCSKDTESRLRYPKRKVPRMKYTDQDVPARKEFLYCEICKEKHRGSCPVHGPLLLVCDAKIPKGKPDRAKRTLPYFFSTGTSSIPNAGIGVWTEIPLVEGMVFGPYEGDIIKKCKRANKSGYAWQVRKEYERSHYVDAANDDHSNWMRYVNCADHEERQSVVAFQYRGKIYYKTYKPVLPHTEILVWYGDDYASKLGIETKERKRLPAPKKITGFSCEVCGNLFSSSEILMKHRRGHPHMQGDKRLRCTECSYSCDRRDFLLTHLLTHSGEKPHACPLCPKRFTTKSCLRRHNLLHTGEKKHACSICGKRFTHKHHLVKHERVHSGERPYRCSDCGKDFAVLCHLKQHLLLHTRQRPYPCSHCEKRFTRLGILREHISSIHTRVFPHNCATCGKGFISPAKLKKHIDRQHGDSGN